MCSSLFTKFNEVQDDGFSSILEWQTAHTQGYAVLDEIGHYGRGIGGIRLKAYGSNAEALNDAKRLVKSMTQKCRAYEIPMGGAKMTISLEPNSEHLDEALLAAAEIIKFYDGQFITGGDLNIKSSELRKIFSSLSNSPEHIKKCLSTGFEQEISIATAYGCLGAIESVLAAKDISQARILIQGVGAVGKSLAKLLVDRGHQVLACDTDTSAIEELAKDLPITVIDSVDVYTTDCDIFSPCAEGGVLTTEIAVSLSCHFIAGSANNLIYGDETPVLEALADRGIEYVPDYIINAGGVIFVSSQYLQAKKSYSEIGETIATRTMQYLREQQVIQQYDSVEGAYFYRRVMGDNADIHYGIFDSENDSTIDASNRVVDYMIDLAKDYAGQEGQIRLIDFGSGNGGAAQRIAKKCGWAVTCLNLSPSQNSYNRSRIKAQQLEHIMQVVEGSFESVPLSIERESFDIVWSEEAFCHSVNKATVFKEAWQLLKPKGVLLFTDIMGSTLSNPDDLQSFVQRNAVGNELFTDAEYLKIGFENGFQLDRFEDFSEHLPANFRNMVCQIDKHREALLQENVAESYIENFHQSLCERVEVSEKGLMRWGLFAWKKQTSADMS